MTIQFFHNNWWKKSLNNNKNKNESHNECVTHIDDIKLHGFIYVPQDTNSYITNIFWYDIFEVVFLVERMLLLFLLFKILCACIILLKLLKEISWWIILLRIWFLVKSNSRRCVIHRANLTYWNEVIDVVVVFPRI